MGSPVGDGLRDQRGQEGPEQGVSLGWAVVNHILNLSWLELLVLFFLLKLSQLFFLLERMRLSVSGVNGGQR